MGTCVAIGGGGGTAADIAVREKISPRGVYQGFVKELKQTLMEDDCYLPFNKREVPQLTLSAKLNCEAEDAENLRNGLDRPIGDDDNGATVPLNSAIEYDFGSEKPVHHVRIIFDGDLDRTTQPEKESRRNRNMLHNRLLGWPDAYVAKTLTKAFRIEGEKADGTTTVLYEETNNRQRFCPIDVEGSFRKLRLVPIQTWGNEKCHLFSFDVR